MSVGETVTGIARIPVHSGPPRPFPFVVEVTPYVDFVIGQNFPATEEFDPDPSNNIGAASTFAVIPVDFDERGGIKCFIATAAYGSYLDPHVRTLRDFRDEYLLTNAPGRAFVDWYYRTSPPIASFIAEHKSLRVVTRAILIPVVFAIEYPAPMLGVLVIIGAGLRIWTRQRRRRRETEAANQQLAVDYDDVVNRLWAHGSA